MRLVYLALLLQLTSCTTNRSKFKKLIANHKCDEAALNMPGFQMNRTKANAEEFGSRGASYVLTGSAYGVDLIYFITAGVVLPAVVCSPALFLDAPLGAGGDADVTGACFEKIYSATQQTDNLASGIYLGDKVFEKTSGWRCPDFTFAVKDVSEVANCHERSGNFEKAIKQLKILVTPESFGGCINPEDEEELMQKISALRVKMTPSN